MKKVLMVCLGNICRSPMAHGIMAHKVSSEGIPVTVDSAGTASYHIGEAPDDRAIKKAKQHGIDISDQRGRQFSIEDFDTFDHIFAMDYSNYENILRLARSEQDKAKVQMILNLIYPGENMSVPDPYYGGEAGFENVYQLLNQATDVLMKELNEN